MTHPNLKTIIQFSFLIFVMLVNHPEGRSKFDRSAPTEASKAKSPKEKGLSTLHFSLLFQILRLQKNFAYDLL